MTELLTAAFEEASHLPAEDQDRFAQWILAELKDEAAWAASFSKSQSVLAELAAEAVAEYRSGRTEPFPTTESR